jgi:hypothetical protein
MRPMSGHTERVLHGTLHSMQNDIQELTCADNPLLGRSAENEQLLI